MSRAVLGYRPLSRMMREMSKQIAGSPVIEAGSLFRDDDGGVVAIWAIGAKCKVPGGNWRPRILRPSTTASLRYGICAVVE
jgi:hypothetical protein